MNRVAHPNVDAPSQEPRMLHEFMLSGARLSPDGTAFLEAAEDGAFLPVSYRELERRTHAYAGLLAPLGMDVGDRVVLEADTSADAVAMLLACSLLGLTFVPVSPETPAERVATITELADPALFLTTAATCRIELPEGVGSARFTSSTLTVRTRPAHRERRRHRAVATDPAYIIFTSGTTGRPKGVVMTHRGIVSYLNMLIADSDIPADERIATTAPLQFDLSLFDVGMALGSRACVVPVPRSLLRWPRRFLRFLDDAGVTQVNGVPAIWRQSLRREPGLLARLDRLRAVLFSGEEFPLPELRRLRELRPGIRVLNSFGHTECMSCSLTEVPDPLPDDAVRLSIGNPHPGSEGMLIGPDGQLVRTEGVVGELYLRSPAMFSGYWNDPRATAAARVPDPLDHRSGQLVFRTGDLAYRGPDGELYYYGRTDSQVQIRGNRVELGEVRSRVEEHPAVAGAAVLALPDADGEPALFAFVTTVKHARASDGAETGAPAADAGPAVSGARSPVGVVTGEQIRAFCAASLPGYMVPREIRFLDELPLTQNGKVDRAALQERA